MASCEAGQGGGKAEKSGEPQLIAALMPHNVRAIKMPRLTAAYYMSMLRVCLNGFIRDTTCILRMLGAAQGR